MKLKLACADFTFPLLPHARALDLISMLEFEGVDIGLFEGRSHLWPSQVFTAPARAGAELAHELKDRGLRCADVFLQMDPSFIAYAINQPNAVRRQHARDWFVKTLEFAAASAAKHVTTLPGVYFEDQERGDSWKCACDELAWRIACSAEYGIVFGVEAHVGSIVPDPNEAERLVRDVPGLTLTLDYTHFTRNGMPDSAIEPLIQYASHFHARGACPGRLQASTKQNTIDYGAVLGAMARTNYSGYVGVEYVWIDWEHCNEVDNLSETILLRAFLLASMDPKRIN
jgi:sugar phosphate isomerase/epimerase